MKVAECLYRYSANGVYYALVRHRGKLFQKSLETKEQAVAKRKLADYRVELAKVDVTHGRMTLAELCDRYLLTVQNQKPRTVRRKTDIVARIKSDWPGGADVQISKVKQSAVETWLAGYDFGYASHNLYLECITAIFGLALNDRLIMANPAAGVGRKKVVKPLRDTPSLDQFRAIIVDVKTQSFNMEAQESADFLEFMGLVGVGQAEASALKWKDVDFEKGKIRFYRHKTSTPFTVPIYPQVRPLLERRFQSDGRAAYNGNVFTIKDAKKALSAACKRLGFPPFTQRSLRRMFITRCIELGIDVKVIAEWQGHQDGGKLILATYSHVRQPHVDEMARKLTFA